MKNKAKIKVAKKDLRHKRVRAKIKGTKQTPRLVVFRSLKHIYTQIINDQEGKTILQASDTEIKDKKIKNKTDLASKVGELTATKAKDKKITKCVFDRAGYRYHGRVKALAEGARQGGLEF